VLAIGPEHEKRLRREFDARRDASLDLSWLGPKQIQGIVRDGASAGMRMRDGFVLDPYRAALGLAAAARRRGARFFERSRARKVRFTRKHVDVIAEGGTIRAGYVVIATGSATDEFKSLQRHFKPRESYVVLTEPVPATVRRQLGPRETMLRDTRVPPHLITWAHEDRLLVGGADQNPPAGAKRAGVLVQRTGQLMYELLTMFPAISGLRPEYGWETTHGETADGLMYIGAHRNYPRHLFALGGPRDSVTGAFVAARVLLRAIQGTPDKVDEAFAWTR
jgi:glycine/D-amino acid oxidase-like deaminating enzyme